MKFIIFFIVAIMLACTIAAGDDDPGSNPIFSQGTEPPGCKGFYMKPIGVYNPFSPVWYLEFSLPESSLVSLFVTDTLGIDTFWCCFQECMVPGEYRTDGSEVDKGKAYLSCKRVDVHLLVTSTYNGKFGYPIECTYEARRRMR